MPSDVAVIGMANAVSGHEQTEALMPVLVVKTVDQIEVWYAVNNYKISLQLQLQQR